MNVCCLFWFTVLNTLRRSTGEEGKKTRSKVTVFNSKGILRQQQLSASCRSQESPVVGGCILFFSIENLRKRTHKRQTQSQCNPNRCRFRTQERHISEGSTREHVEQCESSGSRSCSASGALQSYCVAPSVTLPNSESLKTSVFVNLSKSILRRPAVTLQSGSFADKGLHSL